MAEVLDLGDFQSRGHSAHLPFDSGEGGAPKDERKELRTRRSVFSTPVLQLRSSAPLKGLKCTEMQERHIYLHHCGLFGVSSAADWTLFAI